MDSDWRIKAGAGSGDHDWADVADEVGTGGSINSCPGIEGKLRAGGSEVGCVGDMDEVAAGGSDDRDFRAGVDGCRGVKGKVGADRSNN